ncbi:MAG: tRNA (guanosine(46)-N7)-methyltransferase TrmB [Bdellovibrionales bacterium RIFOXYD12_FULL_39_22]|nr:MAG: tRNA (guanosine(46)-N7)-methyltransferase TrmB [Bdellovibrionales bacterium RIFOXYB1_FULL_39_21]OFZ43642.1 MAG: tRNA (guanosine(46)-N7)-methyltransferase TrmB [Bdellovibrionales bacterium RIFOXYC12_FULL_39_17]OFZ44661.1 MAG: tRNA (guanosine(46)-N7)-methyltransferase TrmB [Bdellovibrionales bacterium RIFOXYC1_FULL_39_130]OFZ71030.1 MAG: tRNA (guanosine(46)-N7)-methyltransferase TrmB [Bdellovibrionales bacterium RIFOXYC2_FULL_39_8]OFZ76420.1 MAG: tRNA (guanosine(46)-N7)-methyltransferase 
MVDFTFNDDFVYTHDNPYHEKLAEFSHFVLRDKEAEKFKGRWRQEVFANGRPIVAEIGSGHGDFMAAYCSDHKEINFLGMDFRFKRSFQIAKKLAQLSLSNFRYLRARGERLNYMFAESEIDSLFYFFPDPWPKRKQQKRRLFQEHFLETAYKVLRPGGEIFIKTDHDGYAEWMMEIIAKQQLFELTFFSNDLRGEFPEHFLSQYITKFEKIFIGQNMKIKAFVLKSKKG